MGQAKLAWTCAAVVSLVAAAVTTAGNLLFTGELTGDFLAFDAPTAASSTASTPAVRWAAGS
ncbi:MAG: hypothetical protein U0599_08885 [Vicinamibacteria bacterium]